MSLSDNDAVREAQRIAGRFLDETSHNGLRQQGTVVAEADPQAAADRVAEQWMDSARSLVLACAYFVAALHIFENSPEKLDVFLSRLVVRRVLSENDILARWKANGKLAMLRKIGQLANALLLPSLLCLLPAHYSIIYQICLLIEEIGPQRAETKFDTHSTRDDIIKVRAESKTQKKKGEGIAATATFNEWAAQLFALRLTAQSLRPFANEYVAFDTLHRCLHRPQATDDAGLVAIMPILMLGTFERALMPLLGFGALHRLFLETGLHQPEITSRDVIVVAKRGNFRPQPLTRFPADSGHHDILTLADFLFPDCTFRCQLFAQARADGWTTFIDDENWIERPSVR